MKTNKVLIISALALFFVSEQAFAARVPSAKSAGGMAESFFKSYGHKYKDSIFGKNPLQKAEINAVREQSRGEAVIEAYLNLKSGEIVRVLLTAKKTSFLGWSIKSWETIDPLY